MVQILTDQLEWEWGEIEVRYQMYGDFRYQLFKTRTRRKWGHTR